MDNGAVPVVASHMGRPKGKVVESLRLGPVAERLSALLERSVHLAPGCVGDAVSALIARTPPGEAVLLENLRFHPEEEANDPGFARALAGLCDVYVNDAFAVSHRSNASVDAIAGFASVAVAGFLLEKEISTFEKALKDPARPLAAIVGGAKVSSKLGALKNLLSHVDKLLIGGAMANTFLRAKGLETGRSLVEADLLESASGIMDDAVRRGVDLRLPSDVVVAAGLDASAGRPVAVDAIPADVMALDIGPESVRDFQSALDDCGTIVWNGPMGVFEKAPFSEGTMAMARAVAAAPAASIVGGGDTDAAIHRSGVADSISYISTGGGAFLRLLEGKPLPGVTALERRGG
jgi:phosphoglycerate kinase